MSVADEFPIPPGDPAGLQAAGSSLKRVAADVGRLGGSVRSEQAGRAAAWMGAAGPAAATETTSLATITEDKGRKVGEGAAAFTAYGTALETAITAVQEIRRQALAADSDARSEANRQGRNLPPEDKTSLYTSFRDQALAPLRQRYRSVIETLDGEGRKAATALTGAIPEYKSGMSPAAVALAVRKSAAARLPSVYDADAAKAGAELAGKMAPYLEKGENIPADLLAQAEEWAGSAFFARSLLTGLGPDTFAKLAVNNYAIYEQEAEYNKRSLTLFGKLLAVGTSSTEAPLPASFVDGYLAKLDPNGENNLTDNVTVLKHLLFYGGTFGQDFLKKAGDKLYLLDKSGNDSGFGSLALTREPGVLTGDPAMPRDVMEVFFGKIAAASATAKDFFRDPERLQFYVLDRKVDSIDGDKGASLGEALKAATTLDRNGGASGRESAQIASNLFTMLGGQKHDVLVENHRDALAPRLADILGSYRDDIYYTLSRKNQVAIDVPDPDAPGLRHGIEQLSTDTWGIALSPDQIRQVLGQIDHDTEAYKKVISAELDAADRFLAADMAYLKTHPLERDDLLTRYGSGYGRVLDTLFTTHFQVQHAMGVAKDDADGAKWRTVVTVANVAGSVIPFVPALAAGPLIGRVGFGVTAGAALPWLINWGTGTAGADAADAKSVNQVNSWFLLHQYAQVDRIQDGGGFTGTSGDVNRWMDEHDIPPEARFVDANGKVLPQEKLTAAQADAYLRWHVDADGHGVGQATSQLTDAIESQVTSRPPALR